MKVGDLVKLSSYGKKLAYLEGVLLRREYLGNDEELVGMVVQIQERAWVRQYVVNWIGKGPHPKGRAHRWSDSFNRKDLKVYKKA